MTLLAAVLAAAACAAVWCADGWLAEGDGEAALMAAVAAGCLLGGAAVAWGLR